MGQSVVNFTPDIPMRLVFGMLVVAVLSGGAHGFRFSEEEAKTQDDSAERAQRVADLVSVPCKESLKGRKIMTVIAERTSNGYITQQERYGLHFQAINRRLRALGLKTYTQDEIRAQIAQAEIDAYFRNDPDAALAASRKLGASYVLRGTIQAHTGVNAVLRIDEVAVHMAFSLVGANGQTLSDVSARAESYSGTDTLGMALTLVNEQADELVAQLYNDYCRRAAAPARRKK